MSRATAANLGVTNNDIIEIKVGDRGVNESEKERVAVWIVPGHADECVTVYLGYGRTRGGRVAVDAGFNAYALRTEAAPWFAEATISKSSGTYLIATTQGSQSMDGRDLIRVASAEQAYLKVEHEESLKPEDEDNSGLPSAGHGGRQI